MARPAKVRFELETVGVDTDSIQVTPNKSSVWVELGKVDLTSLVDEYRTEILETIGKKNVQAWLESLD